MSAALRDRQKDVLCDTLAAVPPNAPTMCPGWDAHDLAVHLWQLKHDPASWPGAAIPLLAGYSARRAARVKAGRSYDELVADLRADDGAIACMPEDRFEDHRHALGEYWVHTQDVALPNGVAQPEPDAALREALWKRVRVAALALNLTRPGLVLALPDGRSARITPGRERLRVTGESPDLMLWTYRREGARVTVTP